MSGTPSRRADPRAWLFGGWLVFATASLVVMLRVPNLEVIAFHLIWVSLAIVYGVQSWSTRRTGVVLAVVIVTTGAVMGRFVADSHDDWQELTEVPLMAMVFITMVWNVRRRAAALAETQDLVERERRAQHVKELFVRNCSHEMRTPITVARGYAELVRRELPAGGGRDDLDVVVDELDKLGGLAGRLLVLADAYETAEFDWGTVDVAALVQRTAQRWRPTANRDWVVAAEPAKAEGDEARLEAALDALVENAVKFTVGGDTVALRCRAVRGRVVVEVQDSGIGFARSRLDDGSSPPESSGRPGTGLGLAIVRAVAEGHGGTLFIDEQRPVGSLLRIELPTRRSVAAPGLTAGITVDAAPLPTSSPS